MPKRQVKRDTYCYELKDKGKVVYRGISAVEILEEEYPRQLKDAIPKNYMGKNLDALDL